MVLASWLPGLSGVAATGGVAGTAYLLLVSVAALTAIFSKKKVRRDAAKEVLWMLWWCRRDR
ncbi:MAG: hypothetical protein ACRDRS_15055 [Pseudonocardiaceae bacterium]